jgi:hypothetical protein
MRERTFDHLIPLVPLLLVIFLVSMAHLFS